MIGGLEPPPSYVHQRGPSSSSHPYVEEGHVAQGFVAIRPQVRFDGDSQVGSSGGCVVSS